MRSDSPFYSGLVAVSWELCSRTGNKNGYIVTDFIMILLLSSIHTDDNGIVSPIHCQQQKHSFYILCLIWYMFRFYPLTVWDMRLVVRVSAILRLMRMIASYKPLLCWLLWPVIDLWSAEHAVNLSCLAVFCIEKKIINDIVIIYIVILCCTNTMKCTEKTKYNFVKEIFSE